MAIKKTNQSIVDAYHKAVFSARETLYPSVLLACALAPTDETGFFAASDVRKPLTEIMKKQYDIPAYSPHLHALSDAERGPVLQKRGKSRRYRFRFVNPLLQPYVIMNGLAAGKVSEEELANSSATLQ